MEKNKKDARRTLILSVVACSFAAVMIFGLHSMVTHFKTGQAKSRAVQMVKILTPPPPPKPLEKPPEPEVKEVPKEQTVEVAKDTPDKPDEGPPPGQDLGVDAAGGAGGDAFGLVGKQGGRALVGSDPNGGQGLMQKYGWYVHIIEDQISKELVRKAKLPAGNLQTYVIISLDDRGNIMNYRIYASSGSDQMDSAVQTALGLIRRINEPPPEGMPKILKIKISAPA